MPLLNLSIAALCVAVLIQLASCASDHVTAQKPLKHYGNNGVHQAKLTLPLLPRKLKLQEEVKSLGDKGLMLQEKLMEASSGKKENKMEENVVHRKAGTGKGTWRQWVDADGPKKSEYFTMDYNWVRRRRPIHNKQIPFFP